MLLLMFLPFSLERNKVIYLRQLLFSTCFSSGCKPEQLAQCIVMPCTALQSHAKGLSVPSWDWAGLIGNCFPLVLHPSHIQYHLWAGQGKKGGGGCFRALLTPCQAQPPITQPLITVFHDMLLILYKVALGTMLTEEQDNNPYNT